MKIEHPVLKFLKDLNARLFADVKQLPPAMQNSYFPALDGLRAVAVLVVLLAHIGLNKYLHPLDLYLDATLGVHIFFMISGFLITTLLLKEKLAYGHISLRRFYIRRALRILPVAYLFLFVLIGLNNIYHLKVPASQFIASFLFYKNLPLPNEPYSAHFWTLAVEEQFYLTFPLLLAYNSKKYIQLVLVIVIAVPLVCILDHANTGLSQGNVIWHLLSKLCQYAFWKGPVIILVGSVFSILVFKGIIRPERIKANYFLSFILLVIAVTVSSRNFFFYDKYISVSLTVILTALVIVITIGKRDLLSAILNNGFLKRIGILSYSIYIWQQLFINARPWQPWLHAFGNYPLWVLIIIKLIAIAVIAGASYQFEAVFLRIKRRYGNKEKLLE